MNAIFNQWLAGHKILTAEEVKKMEPGQQIWMHQMYGREGEHMFAQMTIIQSGKKKVLKGRDWKGNSVFKDIKSGDRIAYTEDW